MGWASGFATGTNMARQWIDTYNQANTQRELKALDEERKRGLGRPATLDELNAANAETDRLQQSDTDTFELASDEQAKFNNRKVESGTVGLAPMSMRDYYSRKAAVYNKYGNPQMADQLDQRAYQMGRDEKNDQRQSRMDESTLKTQAQQREHTGLQITAAQRAQADDQAWRNFNAERSQLKNPDDMTAINALAKKHLNYDQQLKLVGDMTKMGELEALQLAQSTAKKVRDAGNLAGLAIAFRNDPDLDPGSYFEYRTDPKTGAVQVQFFNADKTPRGTPIQYGSEAEAYYSLGKSAVDPASIYTFLREQQDRERNNRKIDAGIVKDLAMANNYNAEARYTRAGKPGAGGSGADYVKALLPQMRAERVDAKRALAEAIQLAGNDPKKIDAATRQYEATMQEIDEHYAQYGARTPRAGADFAPPPRPKDGNQPPPADVRTTPAPDGSARTQALTKLEAKYGRGKIPRSEFFDWKGDLHTWATPEDIDAQYTPSPMLRGLGR